MLDAPEAGPRLAELLDDEDVREEAADALVGLRAREAVPNLLKALKHSRVVITERNTPRAVVLDYEDYQRMKDLIELAEEGVDAIEIERRKKKTKKFLSHEQALKELSLK